VPLGAPQAADREQQPQEHAHPARLAEEEPNNPRVLSYLGTEELARGKAKRALGYFRRYLALEPGWDEERAQVHRKHALAHIALGQHDQAIQTALQALELHPAWPDSHLSLAEAYYHKGEVGKAYEWARQVLERGMPDSMLILNPIEYTAAPRVLMAGCLGGMGQLDEAIAEGERALQIVPGHAGLETSMVDWRRRRKLDSTANTCVGLADVLVANDQQADALAVLGAVPHFVRDHPAVVEKRSVIRERIDTGRVESFTADEDVLAIGDQLPRCHFLLRGLREQAGLA
jgi:tetratricopeptide (TPR) repeat protein